MCQTVKDAAKATLQSPIIAFAMVITNPSLQWLPFNEGGLVRTMNAVLRGGMLLFRRASLMAFKKEEEKKRKISQGSEL